MSAARAGKQTKGKLTPEPTPTSSTASFKRILILLSMLVAGMFAWHTWSTPSPDVPTPDTTDMENQVVEAIEVARATLIAEPSATTWGRLGMVFQAHGLSSEAESCYRNAQQSAPEDYRWPYLLATMAQDSDPAISLSLVQRAIALSPAYAPAFVLRGQLLEITGANEEALAAYHEASRVDSECAAAVFALGRLSFQKGDLEKSLDYLERAGKLQPYAGAIQAFLARAYRGVGQDEAARRAADKASELFADIVVQDPVLEAMNQQAVSTIGLQGRIRRAEAMGDHGDATRLFRRLIEIHPDGAGFHYNFANLLERIGDREQAARLYEKTLALDPHFTSAMVNLGNIKATDGDPAAAIVHFERAIEMDPDHLSAIVSLASVRQRAGNGAQAEQLLRRALELDSGQPQALQGMGQLLASRAQLVEALSYSQRALRIQPDNAALHLQIGDLFARQNQFEKAWEHVHESQRLGLTVPTEFLVELRSFMSEPELMAR